MKWSLMQLNLFTHKGLYIDETVDLNDITAVDSSIRSISPVHVTGRADLSSKKATFHLKIEGTMILPCTRTLVDVNFPFTIETKETFLFETASYTEEDEEIHVLQGDVVDLIPIIKENILLEIPMQIYADSINEEGAAPQSGKGWSVVEEEEQGDKIDPRLAGLAKFFEKKDE
ncbi:MULTISPECIES: YceD family protein [Sutcliffiella]|uniref:DUF177 domain-containing protein n=1 Tax=Sutcliffiella cohnii TaxID=33932 RepID=A0A223KRQ0_9BACI|nr:MULTISPECIES: DUF177 domain-containing protein [Sutcliffiella]AST92162.1 hypothetical protein BC6307_13145 [Sutcliffiella cohnii]MED4015448.1 DUF177 domain-containing protein [Sutcliffiella cohnii]WBL13394.1 DUF177 domain-containing protein [Sutcliffiella sp. NC1]